MIPVKRRLIALPEWQTGILAAEMTTTGGISVGSSARVVRQLRASASTRC